MKNLHVIPVDKEPVKGDLLLRHIWKGEPNECISWWRYNDTTMYGDTLVYTTLNGSFMDVPSSFKVQNIYITNDEDINENDYIITKDGRLVQVSYLLSKDLEEASKVILTTDHDLFKDGVQAINDEFLEWFVKNISCEFVEVVKEGYKKNGMIDEATSYKYKIIIPKEEPKQDTVGKVFYESADKTITVYRQETLEEAAERLCLNIDRPIFKQGAKWQQEQDKNKYSEEEVIFFIKEAINYPSLNYNRVSVEDWFEQFKKK
jgi:hypothetical protein